MDFSPIEIWWWRLRSRIADYYWCRFRFDDITVWKLWRRTSDRGDRVFFLSLSVDRMISFSINNIFALVFGGISLMFQRGPVYLWTSVKCRFRPGQIYNGRRVLFGSKVGSSPSPRSSRWNLNRRLSRRCFFSVDRKEGKFRLGSFVSSELTIFDRTCVQFVSYVRVCENTRSLKLCSWIIEWNFLKSLWNNFFFPFIFFLRVSRSFTKSGFENIFTFQITFLSFIFSLSFFLSVNLS